MFDLLTGLARVVHIPLNVAKAVMLVESGGRGFGADGRMIIRFENHIFEQYVTPDVYAAHFRHSSGRVWQEHYWRNDGDWMECHQGQAGEWDVFEFARTLNEAGAMLSISMGSAQIMGFNYKRVGYGTVQEMFADYSASIEAQTVGFFAYVSADQSAVQALRDGDYATFARAYNGAGQVDVYARLIREALDNV